MGKVQTAVVVVLVALGALTGGITLLLRRRAAHREELLRTKARDMRERMESDRVEIARREAEAARTGARALATRAETDESGATPDGAGSGGSDRTDRSGPADDADEAEQLRYADQVDPELPRVVAERDRGDDVR